MSTTEPTFVGPTSRTGSYKLTVNGGVTAKVLRNIIKQLEIYERMLAEDETLPPEMLPRVAGEVVVVCPACETAWKFDDHDNCPKCNLAPQGVN